MPVQLLLQVRMLQVAAYVAACIAIYCITRLQPPLDHVPHDQVGIQLVQPEGLIAVRICGSNRTATTTTGGGRRWLQLELHPVQGARCVWVAPQ